MVGAVDEVRLRVGPRGSLSAAALALEREGLVADATLALEPAESQ